MTYTNSSLVQVTKLSPNNSGARVYPITRITPHCVVGQCSAETLGNIFANPSYQASSNYGIGYDGSVCMCVEEKNRSWCSSSYDNDNRAITIECASDSYEPYAFKDAVYQKLILLCVDICKRNGKKKLLWFGDKTKTLNYNPKSDEMVLTVHRWFANKSCPGDWMYSRMSDLANKVTAQLNGEEIKPTPEPEINKGEMINMELPMLRKGDNNNSVHAAMVLMKDKGYYPYTIPSWDKLFGSKMEAGVRKMQREHNLGVDGIIGKASWTFLLK